MDTMVLLTKDIDLVSEGAVPLFPTEVFGILSGEFAVDPTGLQFKEYTRSSGTLTSTGTSKQIDHEGFLLLSRGQSRR